MATMIRISPRGTRRLEKSRRADRDIRQARIRYVMQVTLTELFMPEWAKKKRIPELPISEDKVWLRPKDAVFLAARDREAGGQGLLVEMEFRKCGVCKRPLLGEEAAARRHLDQISMTSRQLPCGGECLAAERERRWR